MTVSVKNQKRKLFEFCYSWLSIGSKNRSSNRFEIPTNFILKFRYEHEEFSLLTAKFGSNSQIVQCLESWMNKILRKPSYDMALLMTKVYDVVQVTSKLFTHKEKGVEIYLKKRNKFKTSSSIYLKASMKYEMLLGSPFGLQCDNNSPEFLDHKYELKVFLVVWLAQHVFLRCPNDGISQLFIPIAIKISQGMHLPLALLYLRNLYKRFDLYHPEIEILVGQYKILMYVDVFFIQMCLWERFNVYASPPNPNPFITTSLANSPRIIISKRSSAFFLVNSTMLPSMIENSSVGTNKDSHSMEMYSMCRVSHQFWLACINSYTSKARAFLSKEENKTQLETEMK
ncbi:hypothetical protein ES332_A10G098400v1 [Gossypium tomentosum]|uniref:Aminotransferase-like plant mobile domain-containing protein n=1 Tax=Gossypium tomentosum TaxID=34277 RepID=A0A5D2NR51_GOSTO|nr:hypothetical protein ES332_A10G098400v1 [Gossypium tomentosum]